MIIQNIAGQEVLFLALHTLYPPKYRGDSYKSRIKLNTGEALTAERDDPESRKHLTFRSPGHDIYLFTMIVEDVPPPFKLNMAGVDVPMGVTHSSGSLFYVTICRNVMSLVEKGQNVSIQFRGHFIWEVPVCQHIT